MKNKVYVLCIEDYFAGEQHFDVALFDTREKAQARLQELKDEFYENYGDDMKDRMIDANTEDEFDCYLQGWYNTDRYVLYIIEREIN